MIEQKIKVFSPEKVIQDVEEDEAIALLEIIRRLNEEKIRKIRELRSLKKKLTNYMIISGIIFTLITISGALVNLYISLTGIILLLLSVGYFYWRIDKTEKELESIRSNYKIEEIAKINYPLLLAKVGEKPVVLDLGAHGKEEHLKYLDYADKDLILQELSKVEQINEVMRKEVLSASTAREAIEKIKKLGKAQELESFKSIDGIFIPEVSASRDTVKSNVEEKFVPSRFISLDDYIEEELGTILSRAKHVDLDPDSLDRIEEEHRVLIGIKPEEAIRISEEVFLVAEELAEQERGEGSIKLVKSMYEHLEAYKGILENMQDILRSTISTDPITFKMSINSALCPECTRRYIEDIVERVDVKRWTEMKILGGVLDDPDLNSPEIIDPKDVEKFKEKIQIFMDENLPIAHPKTFIVLSRPPKLEGPKKLKCPKCGKVFNVEDLEEEGYLIPNVFIPLARGFATLFEEGKTSMINKASTIINNIHRSKISKNERRTQLVTYKVHIEELQMKLEEAKAKVEQSEGVIKAVKRL
ncbi:MAG: hypothetical protein ACP6IP_07955 [Candidatus Njordarchaeia archaeon]